MKNTELSVIDGTDAILGRLASRVALRLIRGDSISIVNVERMVITGRKKSIVEKFERRIGLHGKGNPEKGPKFPKMPHQLVKKSIEGMLPEKGRRTADALRRLKVFIGVPKELEGKAKSLPEVQNALKQNFITVAELCRELGAAW